MDRQKYAYGKREKGKINLPRTIQFSATVAVTPCKRKYKLAFLYLATPLVKVSTLPSLYPVSCSKET